MSDATVAIAIVTHNAAADLPACLAAIAGLTFRPLELVVVDCASRDGSLAVARAELPGGIPTQLLPLAENLGFAGGMNTALAATRAPYVVTLNADARPEPESVARLLARLEAHPALKVAAVTGRLLRPPVAGEPRRLDACGMRLTRSWRHLDRGSGEFDRGQYGIAERVFGATGAATLWRRAALDDAAVDGEIFDPRFHSFREDAELCLRLRERAWEILYEPEARIEHRRVNLPERRRRMSPEVNFHSLKNRYLLRLLHETGASFRATFPAALTRDALALGYVLLAEHASWAAYPWLWRNRHQLRQRRRAIQQRRLAPSGAVEAWFSCAGLPL